MVKTTKIICTRKKSPLGSLPVSTFWPDFCSFFYVFFFCFRFYMQLISTFVFNIAFNSETLPSPLNFLFFTDISQYMEKSSYCDKANFSSSTMGGMKQPLLCPKPCHVLETISPWNITEKPFSFKSLQ